MFDGRRAKLPIIAVVLLGMTGFGIAIAQDFEDGSVENEPGDDEGELPVRRRAQLTPQQQVQETGRIAERGENTSRRVMGMLDEARRERDVQRVTCLNDKLTQINAHRRTLEVRQRSLQDAVNLGDESRRNHEFTVITVLGQHFRTLEQEASACVTQDMTYTGIQTVATTIDPAVPEEQMVIPNQPGVTVPFIPPPASPSGM